MATISVKRDSFFEKMIYFTVLGTDYKTDQNGEGLWTKRGSRWKQILSTKRFSLQQKSIGGVRKAIQRHFQTALDNSISEQAEEQPSSPQTALSSPDIHYLTTKFEAVTLFDEFLMCSYNGQYYYVMEDPVFIGTGFMNGYYAAKAFCASDSKLGSYIPIHKLYWEPYTPKMLDYRVCDTTLINGLKSVKELQAKSGTIYSFEPSLYVPITKPTITEQGFAACQVIKLGDELDDYNRVNIYSLLWCSFDQASADDLQYANRVMVYKGVKYFIKKCEIIKSESFHDDVLEAVIKENPQKYRANWEYPSFMEQNIGLLAVN